AQQGAEPAGGNAPSAAAKADYDAAYQKILADDLNGAITAFGAYLKNHPDNSLTPNAWYWLAQAQYRKNLLDDARVSFLNVAQFKDSQKRPDAIFKLGMIKKAQGDLETARKFFNLVAKAYPNDTAAAMALKELEALKQP
ncbi:MAG: tol-pal system protein YbgF, partial [Succinivibrionaceae bacterium]|nr:tol-pal system protein YbgF [Succinivibrionaceae bacterium]